MNNGRDCKHGQLARSCEICGLEAENAALRMHWETRSNFDAIEAENAALKSDRDSWAQQASDRVKDCADFIGQIEALKADLTKAQMHIKHIGNDALRDENAQLKAELAATKDWSRLNNDAAVDMGKQCRELAAELAALREQKPVAWGMPHVDGRIYDVICNEEHAEIEGQYTVPLYAASGAKP